jgi:hypothetical protein
MKFKPTSPKVIKAKADVDTSDEAEESKAPAPRRGLSAPPTKRVGLSAPPSRKKGMKFTKPRKLWVMPEGHSAIMDLEDLDDETYYAVSFFNEAYGWHLRMRQGYQLKHDPDEHLKTSWNQGPYHPVFRKERMASVLRHNVEERFKANPLNITVLHPKKVHLYASIQIVDENQTDWATIQKYSRV